MNCQKSACSNETTQNASSATTKRFSEAYINSFFVFKLLKKFDNKDKQELFQDVRDCDSLFYASTFTQGQSKNFFDLEFEEKENVDTRKKHDT